MKKTQFEAKILTDHSLRECPFRVLLQALPSAENTNVEPIIDQSFPSLEKAESFVEELKTRYEVVTVLKG